MLFTSKVLYGMSLVLQLLRPMMLRRMKEDVEKSLAPKEETIVEVNFFREYEQDCFYIYHIPLIQRRTWRNIEDNSVEW